MKCARVCFHIATGRRSGNVRACNDSSVGSTEVELTLLGIASPRTLRANTNVSPIPSSNCLILTPLFLCIERGRIRFDMRRMKSSQEHTMAQTVVTAAPGEVEAIQADGCGVGSDLRDSAIRSKYKAVRSATSALAASCSAEDQMVQSCPEASPMKWHQAHTTWFFETFVLRPLLTGYKPFREEFRWLFNSYYNSLGDEIPDKKLRASFSRPSLDEVVAYRAHVDQEMERLLAHPLDDEPARRIMLGLNHEQQHQELVLTDIKHAFFSNPLRPSYAEPSLESEPGSAILKLRWHSVSGGLIEIGHPVNAKGPMDFCFDNETPRHRVYLEPFQISNRLVTCREYLEFMSDDAYTRPEVWLSDGWAMLKLSS